MQPAPYSGSATSPQETVAFCHWLLSDDERRNGAANGAANGAVPGTADGMAATGGTRSGLAQWHRLLRDAMEDHFSQLLRAVRREAALLAERSAPQWEEVG